MSEPQPGLVVTSEQEEARVRQVHGRVGNVVGERGDYDASQIDLGGATSHTVKDALDLLAQSVDAVEQGLEQIGGQLFKNPDHPVAASRMLIATGQETVAYASADDSTHALRVYGVTAHATSEVSPTRVEIITSGEVSFSGWSFTPLEPVFLGREGRLTQTFDASWAFVLIVGFALSPTRMRIDMKAPVFLAHG